MGVALQPSDPTIHHPTDHLFSVQYVLHTVFAEGTSLNAANLYDVPLRRTRSYTSSPGQSRLIKEFLARVTEAVGTVETWVRRLAVLVADRREVYAYLIGAVVGRSVGGWRFAGGAEGSYLRGGFVR